ncbi:hypothetical protein PR048_004832 [Dryococelus australis]|uniref:Uncharacterized protein n=1 Tax=Dryococelus australis TaxID=614101 RepID=A0ABQ9I6Z7_9NEOP|nr:hypothetical protein PR048_004832 [Dryococelus australis]
MRVIEVSMERRRNWGGGEREILEKAVRPMASSGTNPTCENPESQLLCRDGTTLSWTNQRSALTSPIVAGPLHLLPQALPAINEPAAQHTQQRGLAFSSMADEAWVQLTWPWSLHHHVTMWKLTATTSHTDHVLHRNRRDTVDTEQHRNARAGEFEIPEKTFRTAASSGTIPTCENPGATPLGIEPGLPWCEASSLAHIRFTGMSQLVTSSLRILDYHVVSMLVLDSTRLQWLRKRADESEGRIEKLVSGTAP